MKLSPVIVCVYNRPSHTRRTLDSLRKNFLAGETELYIFADGPKRNASQETLSHIESARKIIREFNWPGKIIIREKESNDGLAVSLINAVTEVVNTHGKVIVLEDDMETSPWFLQFMNDTLEKYENDQQVSCISGYIYPVKEKLPETFFLKGSDCWGWATWKRGWDIFEKDGKKLLLELKAKNLTHEFDFNGTYDYTKMLEDQIEGKNNSWAIRWYASAFLQNKYCLYPGVSLVQNIGVDGSGTHSTNSEAWNVRLSGKQIIVGEIPVEENTVAKKSIMNYFISIKRKPWLFAALINRLRKK